MEHSSNQRRLSEISHLFLSDVRAKTTGNAPRPVRRPPGAFKPDVSIDLTPEEFAQCFGDTGDDAQDTHQDSRPASPTGVFKPVRLIIAHHLGELMADRIRDLAGMYTGNGKRVGLIYADAGDVRVSCIEHNPHTGHVEEDPAPESLEAQRLSETLVELNQDVDQWMIVLPDPRNTDSRELMRQIAEWTLITGVDHDTVVASYRTIKGLAEGAKPNLSVAIYGAVDVQEVEKTFRKLASVCDQFLHMKSSLLGAIEPGDDLAEHHVLSASASHSKSQLASAPQWKILSDMVLAADTAHVPRAMPPVEPRIVAQPAPAMKIEPPVAIPTPAPAASPVPMQLAPTHDDDYANIIDLPHADASPAAVISAIVKGGGDLVESPVRAPSRPDAIVAVSRDHHLTLVAVAKQGLSELRSVAEAYRWMCDNRQLIAMALPQFSIDTHQTPRLELLVDHADASADMLQPLLERSFVRIKAYRKLRWAGKTGLLLEAA